MGVRDAFPADAVERVPVLMAQVTDANAYRRLVCVQLALTGRSAEQIAAVVGQHPNSVQRVWARYRREGEVALLGRPRGGRRHAYLTPEEEDGLLAPFLAQAEAGSLLVAGPLKTAYEARLGRTVPKSTLYRLLARHGWRKVAPRRHHPEHDATVQEAFKRNSPGWWWTRSSARRRPARTASQCA